MNSEQEKIIHKILHVGRKMHATHKEKLAAIETAIVESGIANLSGGDADSAGWRQERTSIYGADHATSVRKSAKDFFSETASAGHGKGQSAGSLAQSVQRSAYPDRYDQVKSEAKKILSSQKGKGGGGHGGGGGKSGPKIIKKTVHTKGRKPLKTAELFYDPGINIKDGAKTSPIGGHGDHVHYASSNVKSLLRAARIIEKKGGSISENPAFGGVSSGAHVSDSYHYRSKKIPHKLHKLAKKVGVHGNTIGEAFDIGGDLAKIDKALAKHTLSSGKGGGTKTIYVYASGPHKGEKVSKKQAQQANVSKIPYQAGGRVSQTSDDAAKYQAKLAKMKKRQAATAELDRVNAARATASANIGALRDQMRIANATPQAKVRRAAPTTIRAISGL